MGETLDKKPKNKNGIYVLGILFVVLLWGGFPVITKVLLNYYSPGIKSAVSALISFIGILIIANKKIKLINKKYLKVAIPTGVAYAGACITQQIGLDYTTPAMYSFLENLDCVFVPLLLWAFTRKRPPLIKLIAAVICLISVFILSGGLRGFETGFGIGEILCSIAGVCYAFNIVGTSLFAKDLDTTVYLVIQFGVHTVLNSVFALFEEIQFTWDVGLISLMVVSTFITIVIGWLIRTVCLKHLDANLVAILMPFAAVVASVISVIIGTDVLSLDLVLGATIGVIAVIVSQIDFTAIYNKINYKKLNRLEDSIKEE